jgi:hypothetical protein
MINYSKLKTIQENNIKPQYNMQKEIYNFIDDTKCIFDIENYNKLNFKEQIDLGLKSYIELQDELDEITSCEILIFRYQLILYQNMTEYLNIPFKTVSNEELDENLNNIINAEIKKKEFENTHNIILSN